MANIKPSLSTSELETAFESMGEGALIIDRHGLIIRASRIALDLLGYKESELIGEPFISKVTAFDVEHKVVSSFNRPIVRTVLTGLPVYQYLYYRGKNNTHIPVFVSTSPIIKNSKLIGIMEVFRDISMEEAVDQMKSEFISLASHQLRTPLSAIKTYSHMLLDGYMGKIDSQKKPALEIIVSSTNRMNELISTLLNITRLESGAMVVQNRPVDIASIAREVLEEMEIPSRNRSIKLKLIVSGNKSSRIRSDGPIIKEILTNLVSNSVKYSKDKGTVTISVRANDSHVSLIVRDKGLGIPDPAKKQIFSKFFRARNAIQIDTHA